MILCSKDFPFSNYNQITSDSIQILISYPVPDMGFSPEISKPEKVPEINLDVHINKLYQLICGRTLLDFHARNIKYENCG